MYSHSRPLNTATASREWVKLDRPPRFPQEVVLTRFKHRHIESLESRLESTERRLQELSERFDRMENGREGFGRLSERPGSVAGGRIPDSSIDDAEPESGAESADATDGVGSVMFTKEERADAGFFGITTPGSLTIVTLPC